MRLNLCLLSTLTHWYRRKGNNKARTGPGVYFPFLVPLFVQHIFRCQRGLYVKHALAPCRVNFGSQLMNIWHYRIKHSWANVSGCLKGPDHLRSKILVLRWKLQSVSGTFDCNYSSNWFRDRSHRNTWCRTPSLSRGELHCQHEQSNSLHRLASAR